MRTWGGASGAEAGGVPGAGIQTTHPSHPALPQLFNDAIRLAVSYKQNSRDFMDEVLQELEVGQAACR